jgi:hypothetical protein
MKQFAVEELVDVNWQQYLAFGRELRKVTPDGEDLSFDEMRSLMLIAAARAGWITGVDPEEAKDFVPEDLNGWQLWAVLDAIDKVYIHYSKARTPDPN